MRLIKLILISIIVLFGVTAFLFMLFPSDIRISRVIAVNDVQKDIGAVISDMGTWRKWNLFTRSSDLTHISISNPSKGTGAFIHSDKLNVVITRVTPDTVRVKWVEDGKSFSSNFTMAQEGGQRVVVQWYFEFHFRWFPWEKLGSMFYDKQMGPPMEESLINLKHLVENNH
jgi:hypothetical protein